MRTEVPVERMSTTQARGAYQALSKVKRAFPSRKDVDLQIRPIHHRLEDSIRAHIFLCMLAYHVGWHLRRAGEPLLLVENPPKVNGGKKATGRTDDGLIATRYRDLRRELTGYTRNTLRFSQAEKAILTRYPTPSPLRQRAFDLPGINPAR